MALNMKKEREVMASSQILLRGLKRRKRKISGIE